MAMREDLEAAGRRVLERLEEAGYVAYFVGGYVRDRLLGRPIHDIDIATSARPETVMALFPDSLPTGIRHGTVTVRMGDHAFEVTTFRVERGYSDARHPDEVVFVDRIEEDLARRDFTVNAMALDRRGRLVDPFGGREDLAARRIRCVGDPMRRFSEDGLRLVRAVRFAVQLDFAIEPRTWEALQACRETLSPVAHERIADELDKIMASPNPGRGFALLFESRLFAADDLAPYLAPPAWPDLAALAVPEGRETRWALLALLLGWTEHQAEAFARALRFSRERLDAITTLVGLARQGCPGEGEARQWRKLLLAHGLAHGLALADLCAARKAAGGPDALTQGRAAAARLRERVRAIYAAMPVQNLKELAVNGRDLLKAVGRPPGPWVGRLLNELLVRVAHGELPNDKDRLLAYARERGDGT